ncbi:MAG: tetratricopeptide repeat protein [Chloracidobacterium sp.]|nr:tetratricopeptide repeat protein [Chloracidobacterium sp.]
MRDTVLSSGSENLDKVCGLVGVGRSEEALNIVRREIESASSDFARAVAYEQLGNLYQVMNAPSKAIHAFETSLRLHGPLNVPAVTRVYSSLGLAYKLSGETNRALEIYAAGIDRLMDRAMRIIHKDGELTSETEEDGVRTLNVSTDVFERIRELCRLDITFAALRNNMGTCYAEIGDKQSARRAFVEAIEFTPVGFAYQHPSSNLAELDPNEKEVFLDLGIALKKTDRLDEAIEAFRRALEIDPNYDLAFSSLALTQMKTGDFEIALHNYDEAIKAMTRNIVKTFKNSRSKGIIKQHDSHHLLWLEFAFFGAVYLSSLGENVKKLAWPTGDQAIQEERDEGYDGLYWVDKTDPQGETTRLFLPNYFNTFREHLTYTSGYSILLRGKGSALRELGRRAEADEHYTEAEYFNPKENKGNSG